jgi:beta-lysine 5,6-aminomutase beta subunit
MQIRPYGDTRDDGVMQLSFTLPVPNSVKATDVGKQYLEKMGFHDVAVAEVREIDPEFTFYVAYARTDVTIDPEEVKGDYLDVEEMDFYAINKFLKANLGRKLVVVGAAIESDAHTVGIDAILNMKGFAGNYGLERYPEIEAYNLGSQIPCEQLLKTALEKNADAILVSQIVTQKNIHVQNLTKLIELLEAEGVRERFIIVVGGPRINNAFAKELGYDAGFGPRTTPVQVASFLAQEAGKKEAEHSG